MLKLDRITGEKFGMKFQSRIKTRSGYKIENIVYRVVAVDADKLQVVICDIVSSKEIFIRHVSEK